MSSDDEAIDPRAVKSSQSAFKSLFASDSRSGKTATSLKYEAKLKKDDVGASGAAAAAVGTQPTAGASSSGTLTAAQAPVQAYRGETAAGAATAAAVVVQNIAMVLLIDRERRPLCRVRCNSELQLLQNPSSPQYATLYDPAIGQHWTLMFKSPVDCTNFVVATSTLLHYILLADGPVESFQEITGSSDKRTAKKSDVVSYSITVWLLHRLGGSGSTFFSTGKVVEEVPNEAPRSITVGKNTAMLGVEELLIGMGAGCRRLGFISPRKTKTSGIGNPEIGASDSVVVLLTCHAVQKGDRSANGLGGSDSDDANQDGSDDSGDVFSNRKKRRSMKKGASPPPAQAAGPGTALATTVAPPAVASPPTAPAPTTMGGNNNLVGGMDQNTLIQTMLLQTLQLQQQRQSTPPEAARPSPAAFDVDRGLDRIYQQLFSLSEKLDRLDVDAKLAKNNEAIERMVKKAVGKMPTNDVDIEDMAKDRDQLLAKIEHLKHRLEDATDSYHKALETMGTHKDMTSALKNDLSIERETSAARIKELTERKRLELVDAEVRYRQELDRAKEKAFQEGQEQGFQKGLATGKLDALQLAGSSSAEEWKAQLHELQQKLVDAESRYQQQASKSYQERREFTEQINSLNSLIKRLESRETSNAQGVVDTSAAMCKTLRRAMNSTYASIEAQYYATERESISVEDALAMVLISIKSETRTFTEEIKREGAIIASAAATASLGRKGGAASTGDADGEQQQQRSSRAEAVAAYADTVVEPTASDAPRSEATEAYNAMRAEIDAYQQQRDAEARAEELQAANDNEGGGGVYAAGARDEDFALDIDSLPLPPMGGDEEDDMPPPPTLPPHKDEAEAEVATAVAPVPARSGTTFDSDDSDD